jgi:hypothetical protein
MGGLEWKTVFRLDSHQGISDKKDAHRDCGLSVDLLNKLTRLNLLLMEGKMAHVLESLIS